MLWRTSVLASLSTLTTLKVAEKHSAGLSHKILVLYLLSQDNYKIAEEVFVFMDDAAYTFLELHTVTVSHFIALLAFERKELLGLVSLHM